MGIFKVVSGNGVAHQALTKVASQIDDVATHLDGAGDIVAAMHRRQGGASVAANGLHTVNAQLLLSKAGTTVRAVTGSGEPSALAGSADLAPLRLARSETQTTSDAVLGQINKAKRAVERVKHEPVTNEADDGTLQVMTQFSGPIPQAQVAIGQAKDGLVEARTTFAKLADEVEPSSQLRGWVVPTAVGGTAAALTAAGAVAYDHYLR